ncbi:MAG: Maf family protein [Victivallaceae bacterium]|nr:Maf family protein [Victivallaceae bacterium]
MSKYSCIILASQSERRKQLLTATGVVFETLTPEVEEINIGRYFRHIPLINAVLKAHAVSIDNSEAVVIGADTVIEFNNQIIGKPKNLEDSRRILGLLSGQRHFVSTAVCLRCRELDAEIRFVETSEVEFKSLGAATIEQYLSKVFTLDKAGAYNIDEYGDLLINQVKGNIDNIIGLPCVKLLRALHSIQALKY